MTHENLVGLMVYAIRRDLVSENFLFTLKECMREYDSWRYSMSYSFEDFLNFEVLEAYHSGEDYGEYNEAIEAYGKEIQRFYID